MPRTCPDRKLDPVYSTTKLSGTVSWDFGLSRCFVQRHVWGAKPYAERNIGSVVNSRGAELPPNIRFGRRR